MRDLLGLPNCRRAPIIIIIICVKDNVPLFLAVQLSTSLSCITLLDTIISVRPLSLRCQSTEEADGARVTCTSNRQSSALTKQCYVDRVPQPNCEWSVWSTARIIRLFNPPPQFSRLGTWCPAFVCVCVCMCMCVCEFGGLSSIWVEGLCVVFFFILS